MDIQRLLQFSSLALVLVLIWSAWEAEYGNRPVPQGAGSTTALETQRPAEADAGGAPGGAFVPQDLAVEGGTAPVQQAPPSADAGLGDAGTVRVTTDLVDVLISTRGGEISRVDLRDYAVSVDDATPLRLMSTVPSELFTARSLIVTDDPQRGPGASGIYVPDQSEYRMEDGTDRLVVPMVWRDQNGLEITKRYVFERNSYVIQVEHQVRNTGEQPLRASQQVYLRRSSDVGDGTSFFIYTYSGGVISTPEDRYSKLSFDDMGGKPLDRNVSGGWLAMIQHYFVAAMLPPVEEERRYWSRGVGNNVYDLGMNTFWREVPAAGEADFETRLYIGPKEQDRLEAAAGNLELTVDYGWLTLISAPLFLAMRWIHGLVGNWGVSIILITLGIKLVFYKLSEASYRSMARMRKMQPRMQALKERYGDDKAALNQAMMTMYKEEKINPLGGCLPILIQIPVFIALYWVLLESVELRHAPFMLWIQDLSTPDPFFVLPLLMGVTMFIQQKLNPAPLDPIQQKVMMVLPVAFTVFFVFFPAGLVLYWVVNNTLSIAQQWVITKRIESGAEK